MQRKVVKVKVKAAVRSAPQHCRPWLACTCLQMIVLFYFCIQVFCISVLTYSGFVLYVCILSNSKLDFILLFVGNAFVLIINFSLFVILIFVCDLFCIFVKVKAAHCFPWLISLCK